MGQLEFVITHNEETKQFSVFVDAPASSGLSLAPRENAASRYSAMLTEKQREWLEAYVPFIDGNPRRIKRIMNVLNVVMNCCKMMVERISDDHFAKLLKMVILLEQWPYRMAWLFKYVENAVQWDHIAETWKKDKDQSSIKYDAYFDRSASMSIDEMKSTKASALFLSKIHGMIYSPDTFQKELQLDSDPELFIDLLLVEPAITVYDLAPPKAEEELELEQDSDAMVLRDYAFNINPGVLSRVSQFLDMIDIGKNEKKSQQYRRKRTVFHPKSNKETDRLLSAVAGERASMKQLKEELMKEMRERGADQSSVADDIQRLREELMKEIRSIRSNTADAAVEEVD